MPEGPEKEHRQRWRWGVLVVVAVIAAMAWQLRGYRQQQEAWIAGVTAVGARVENPQLGDFDVKDAIGTLFLGKTTLVWIDDESQVSAILALKGDCPRGTHFYIISPTSDDLVAQFRQRFPSRPVSYNPELKRLLELEKNNPNEIWLQQKLRKRQEDRELNDRAIREAEERKSREPPSAFISGRP